ncbi:MAG: hypothetical protein ABEH35_01185 [Haloarculaceae archaeon]
MRPRVCDSCDGLDCRDLAGWATGGDDPTGKREQRTSVTGRETVDGRGERR